MNTRLAFGLCAMILAGGSSVSAQQVLPDSPPVEPRVLVFDNRQDRMTVPVHIGDEGPFNFVIDTGAERSVVSSELASALRLRPGRPARIFSFTGIDVAPTVHVPSLGVSPLSIEAIEAPSLDHAHLGAPGMLGIDALQGHRVTIDFPRKRMTLTPANKRVRFGLIVEADERAGQLIITSASFAGEPIAVIIDTGSPITVGNSAMRALAKRAPRSLGSVAVTSVTGGEFEAEYVAISGLKVGQVNLTNVALSFADIPPFERFGLKDTPALLLGMSTLRHFRRVDIDFANREIAFALPRPPISFSSACRSMSPCRSY